MMTTSVEAAPQKPVSDLKSSANTLSSNASNDSGDAIHHPQVAWYFVSEFYQTLHHTPEKLRLFYNSDSTMSRGVEREQVQLCYGSKEIAKKFESLGFNRCRVLITNVDSQTSAGDGIILQVLGEIANHGGEDEPHKFCQTIFLAPQPGGYYVMNDIFRILKDEDEEEPQVEAQEPETAKESVKPAPEAKAQLKESTAPPTQQQPQKSTKSTLTKSQQESSPAQKPAAERESKAAVSQPAHQPTRAQAPAPKTELAPATTQAAQAPAPQAAKPTLWAGVAGQNLHKWGGQLSNEAKGSVAQATESAKSMVSAGRGQSQTPGSVTPAQQGQKRVEKGQRSERTGEFAGKRNFHDDEAKLYLKGFPMKLSMPANEVRDILSKQVEGIQNVDIRENKHGGTEALWKPAYVEFTSVEATKKALGKSVTIGEHSMKLEEKHRPQRTGSTSMRGQRPGGRGRGGLDRRMSSHEGESREQREAKDTKAGGQASAPGGAGAQGGAGGQAQAPRSGQGFRNGGGRGRGRGQGKGSQAGAQVAANATA